MVTFAKSVTLVDVDKNITQVPMSWDGTYFMDAFQDPADLEDSLSMEPLDESFQDAFERLPEDFFGSGSLG